MSTLTVIARPAIPSDFVHIEAWRAAHFLEMQARQATVRPVTGQAGIDDAAWLVIERDGRPVAAASFRDDAEAKVRRAGDLYAASGFVHDGHRLARMLEAMSDDLGYDLWVSTDPENTQYLRILEKRGYEKAAVHYVRRAHGRIER